MKLPAPPPDFDDLMSQVVSSDRILAVLTANREQSVAGEEYLPWDKLRFKAPPGDLSHEEWWLATKLGRQSIKRMMPHLVAVDGRPFTYALPDEVLRAADEISRSASGHIAISEQVTSPATRDRYLVNSLVEEAITSSQLEGASTSRRVAKAMIRSGRPPRDRSERMILNNYAAMRRITELTGEPLSPALICEIHRIVTDGTLTNPDSAGRVQDDDSDRVAVWSEEGQLLHRPPPVEQLPDRMARLCEFANGDSGSEQGYLPPVLRSIAVHFMMGHDHYFEDGNGRTARALFYWSMLRGGYWLTEFLAISRILRQAPAQYVRSYVLTEQDDGDLTYFFIYHLNVVTRAIRELHGYLAKKAAEMRQLQGVIKSMPGVFNHRQLALLEHAARNPDAVYSVASHANSHAVSGETARHDLANLVGKGLLLRGKLGRQFIWSPVPDLSQRLSGIS